MSLLARRGITTGARTATPTAKAKPKPQVERFRCGCVHCEEWRSSNRVLFTALVDAVTFLESTYKINCIKWTEKEHARIREILTLAGKP